MVPLNPGAGLAIFTDIDWTMMGPGEDLTGVCPTVEKAQSLGIPIIPVTAKSIYEIISLAPRMCLDTGSLLTVAESGGVAYASPGILASPHGARTILGVTLEYVEMGDPITAFKHEILEEANRIGCTVKLLSEADPGLAAMMTGLSQPSARMASMREYLEVVWSPSQECLNILADALHRRGFYVHRSTRLLHVGRHRGKLAAIALATSEPLLRGSTTIGLGDSDADRDYLEHVDIAILVPGPGYKPRTRLMRADYEVAPYPAPWGWRAAVEDLITRLL